LLGYCSRLDMRDIVLRTARRAARVFHRLRRTVLSTDTTLDRTHPRLSGPTTRHPDARGPDHRIARPPHRPTAASPGDRPRPVTAPLTPRPSPA
jgi:hypothetical protein